MNDFDSIGQILWSDDPATQRAILFVLSLAVIAAVTIYLPLIMRLFRLYFVERELRALADEVSPTKASGLLDDFKALLVSSAIQGVYEEFERRWSTAQLAEGGDRAPVRLIDILDERPLFPFGPRRSLIPVLPGLLFAAGAFAALSGLIPSLSEAGQQGMTAEANSAWMAAQLGLAMRAAAWGFICAMGASLTGRLIEGSFDSRSHGLDEVVERAFGSISPGELAELTRRTQQSSLDTLGRELSRFANELNERLDRGLRRIEQSTARSANLVSQEQRGALHTIVTELSLSVRQGVEHHLTELRGALQRAVEHQESVSGSIAATFQSLVENSKIQERVAKTLDSSARSVDEAARTMHGSTAEFQPVLEHLVNTSASLATTADRIGDTQQIVARTADGVRSALEHAATGVDDQRQFLEYSLTEIRQAMGGLAEGLEESLRRSLNEVDDQLSKTVGVLRDTLAESNETIDRLSSPIRAVEGSSREIHLALDRVKGEIEVLGQWMNQASKPLRSGLADVDGRAEEIGRTMVEFNNHARQIDKTMEALRHEIHEESRRIQGAGSELGRRLQQTSDAVGLLEATTSETARRSQLDPNATKSRDRQRPAPRLSREPIASPAPESWSAQTQTPTHPRTADAKRHSGADIAGKTDKTGRGIPDQTAQTAGMMSREPSRDSEGLGYRVGTAKAKGPDPYERFDSDGDNGSMPEASHVPPPRREFDQELGLSGLLGPRSEGDPDPNRRTSTDRSEAADDRRDADDDSMDDRD